MRIAYIEHRFSESSRAIIEHANVLIEDYAEQDLAVTVRQLYYRFISVDFFPNTLGSYKRLGSIINDARLAGLMDWEAIEDRDRKLEEPTHWDSPTELMTACAQQFRIDKWNTQQHRVEVWVEKKALEGIVEQACKPLDCSYFACKGYTSQSEMWRAAQRFEEYTDDGQEPVIIHLGDHDPSGLDMTRDIRDRLNDTFGVSVEVNRIALNKNQIDLYRPPPNPAKLSDTRAPAYVREFGEDSWELDALEPVVLRELIQKSIRLYLDEAAYEERAEEEEEHRRLLQDASSRWTDVVKFLRKRKRK